MATVSSSQIGAVLTILLMPHRPSQGPPFELPIILHQTSSKNYNYENSCNVHQDYVLQMYGWNTENSEQSGHHSRQTRWSREWAVLQTQTLVRETPIWVCFSTFPNSVTTAHPVHQESRRDCVSREKCKLMQGEAWAHNNPNTQKRTNETSAISLHSPYPLSYLVKDFKKNQDLIWTDKILLLDKKGFYVLKNNLQGDSIRSGWSQQSCE